MPSSMIADLDSRRPGSGGPACQAACCDASGRGRSWRARSAVLASTAVTPGRASQARRRRSGTTTAAPLRTRRYRQRTCARRDRRARARRRTAPARGRPRPAPRVRRARPACDGRCGKRDDDLAPIGPGSRPARLAASAAGEREAARGASGARGVPRTRIMNECDADRDDAVAEQHARADARLKRG